MSKILMVRHGETKGNSAERLWGDTDIELGAEGIRQAEQLRDRLAPEKIDFIYTSDMKRAIKTARIIASHHQLDITICPELHELNFGKCEGLTFKEIWQRYPELMEKWPNRDLTFRYPGGESMTELNSRAIKFLSRLNKHSSEETVLVVAHNGVLHFVICHLLQIDAICWRQVRTDLASLSIIETNPNGSILTLLNDVSHLK
ncbi:histidine phosphatase family protein [Chloroflexota bacterium]